MQCNITYWKTARHGAARRGTARRGTARLSTAQHSTAQHITTQHNTGSAGIYIYIYIYIYHYICMVSLSLSLSIYIYIYIYTYNRTCARASSCRMNRAASAAGEHSYGDLTTISPTIISNRNSNRSKIHIWSGIYSKFKFFELIVGEIVSQDNAWLGPGAG